MVSKKVLGILKNAVNQINSAKSEIEKEVYDKQYNAVALPKIQEIEREKREKLQQLEASYASQKEQIVKEAKQSVDETIKDCGDFAKAQVESDLQDLLSQSLNDIGGKVNDE